VPVSGGLLFAARTAWRSRQGHGNGLRRLL